VKWQKESCSIFLLRASAMLARCGCIGLIVCLLMGAEQQLPRTDAFGDPLPKGAIARLGTLRFRTQGVNELMTSPDGRLILAGGGPWHLWDTATGKVVSHPGLQGRVDAALLTPDGKTLLTARVTIRIPNVGHVRLLLERWDVGTGKLLHSVENTFPSQSVIAVSRFSPDGRQFLLHLDRSKLTIWDVETGKSESTIDQQMYPFGVAMTNNGKTFAIPGRDKYLHLYELPSGRLLRKLPGPSTPFAFAPDGQSLAGSNGRSHLLWDVATGRLRHELKDSGGPVAFTPDGKRLACGDQECVRILETATFRQVHRLPISCPWQNALTFYANGKRLAVGNYRVITLWDVETGKQLNGPVGHEAGVISLAFAPDGKSLASGDFDEGVAYVWDVATARPRHRFTGHYSGVAALGFAPDGGTLATGNGHGGGGNDEAKLRLWDMREGQLVRQFPAHLSGISSLAFAPDGKTLASAGYDARVRVWDPATGRRLFQLRDTNPEQAIAFSPDGQSLLICARRDELSLWRTDTWTKLRDLAVRDHPYCKFQFAAFLGGGQAIFSVVSSGGRGLDRAIVLDTTTGGRRHFFQVLPPGMHMALSADGKLFAVASRDSSMELWDVEAGVRLTTVRGHAGPVTVLAWSPDGTMLASGSTDTTVLLWDVPRLLLEPLWSQLARGGPTSNQVKAESGRTVAFIKQRLTEAAAAEKRVRELLPDLDDDRFAVRERASAELVKLGEPAAPTLREALKVAASVEMRRRIEEVLASLNKDRPGPVDEGQRLRRAVGILEAIRTTEARRVLQELAGGDSELLPTRLAREALGRIDQSQRGR
jgi:WD40 repeat protein